MWLNYSTVRKFLSLRKIKIKVYCKFFDLDIYGAGTYWKPMFRIWLRNVLIQIQIYGSVNTTGMRIQTGSCSFLPGFTTFKSVFDDKRFLKSQHTVEIKVLNFFLLIDRRIRTGTVQIIMDPKGLNTTGSCGSGFGTMIETKNNKNRQA